MRQMRLKIEEISRNDSFSNIYVYLEIYLCRKIEQSGLKSFIRVFCFYSLEKNFLLATCKNGMI